MLELNTRLIGLSAFFAKGESNARKSLEKHSLEELFDLHGMLNAKSIGLWYRKYHQKVYGLYSAGSFVVADALIDINKRVIQVHFIPFDSPKKRLNPTEIVETMLLAQTDGEKMFNIVERLHYDHGINEISGQAKKEMALVAQEFGLDIRNHKINHYNNIITTQNIPSFLSQARQKLEHMRKKNFGRFEKHGVTEESARINAILHFMGKVR